jgi:hypothetical protein
MRRYYGSLLPENFQKSGQGSLDVECVDSFALWDEIRIDYALRVKENKDHLLCPRSVHLGFLKAWLSLFHPLL